MRAQWPQRAIRQKDFVISKACQRRDCLEQTVILAAVLSTAVTFTTSLSESFIAFVIAMRGYSLLGKYAADGLLPLSER